MCVNKDFYFLDGSTILRTLTLVYFRVHKSVLSLHKLHSPVFADTFAMPPPSEMDTYDGLVLVHLHDDAEQFYRLFLGEGRISYFHLLSTPVLIVT